MVIGPEAYRRFFYRTAHLWYFDRASLVGAAESAGLTVRHVSTPHHYDPSNFTVWLRDQRSSGLGAVPELAGPASAAFRSHVAALGRGDAINAIPKRPRTQVTLKTSMPRHWRHSLSKPPRATSDRNCSLCEPL